MESPFNLTHEDLETFLETMVQQIKDGAERVVVCADLESSVDEALLARLREAADRIRKPIVLVSTPHSANDLFAKYLGAADTPLSFGARRPGKSLRIWGNVAARTMVDDIVKDPKGFSKEYDATFTRVDPQPDFIVFDEASRWDDAMFRRFKATMSPEEYRRQFQCDFIPTPLLEDRELCAGRGYGKSRLQSFDNVEIGFRGTDPVARKGPKKPYFRRQERY